MAVKRWDGTNWITQASSGGVPLGYNYATVATSAGTDTLVYNSANNRFYTGTSTHTVVLPSTSVVTGQQFTITNNSTGGRVTINASGGTAVASITRTQTVVLTALSNAPTTPAEWNVSFAGITNSPYVKVIRTTALSYPDSTTYTQMSWSSAYSDSGHNMWSSGNAGYVIVPVTGIYTVTVNFGFGANSAGYRRGLLSSTNNGSMNLNQIDGLGTSVTMFTMSHTQDFPAGDAIYFSAYSSGAAVAANYIGAYQYGHNMTVAYVGAA